MSRRRRRSVHRVSGAALVAVLAGACAPAAVDLAATRPAEPPRRIVAASLFATEVLLEIAPRERIAAVHALAADPHFSLVADDVRGLKLVGAEPEQLIAGAPDLVIVDAFTRPETKALLQWAEVPVLCPPEPRSFADIAANIRAVGRACHLEHGAEALAARMEARLHDLAVRGTGLRAFRVCSLDGDLHTYGRGSLVDAMITAAGATSLAAERGAGPYRKLSVETLLAWRPDALLVSRQAGRDAVNTPAWLLQVPGLELLDCARKGRFVFVPGPLLATTSHRLLDAAASVQEQLQQWGRP